jgi:hypothetical protein
VLERLSPVRTFMQAITVRVREAGLAGLSLADMPYPPAVENDVIVRVHAARNAGSAHLLANLRLHSP